MLLQPYLNSTGGPFFASLFRVIPKFYIGEGFSRHPRSLSRSTVPLVDGFSGRAVWGAMEVVTLGSYRTPVDTHKSYRRSFPSSSSIWLGILIENHCVSPMRLKRLQNNWSYSRRAGYPSESPIPNENGPSLYLYWGMKVLVTSLRSHYAYSNALTGTFDSLSKHRFLTLFEHESLLSI